jgi:lipopolysaccharide/colanic/teichoic acid biosynthesis glycosyltransferase
VIIAIFTQVRRFKTPGVQQEASQPFALIAPLSLSGYFRTKDIFDYLLAAILLLPCALLMAACICVVRLTSRGPALYAQRRVGRNGRIFRLYKIRSMTHDAEARSGPAWTQHADPRITRVGRVLRKFHFDELPQLFNVLRGEMSLVGPRPERPEFVEILCRQIPDYSNRLAVKPGITGIAQLNLPPDSDLDSVRRKVILDVEYIRTASLWLDLRLLLCTAMRIAKLPVIGVMGVGRTVKLPEKEAKTSASQIVGTIVTVRQFQRQLEINAANGNGGKLLRHKIRDREKCKKRRSI